MSDLENKLKNLASSFKSRSRSAYNDTTVIAGAYNLSNDINALDDIGIVNSALNNLMKTLVDYEANMQKVAAFDEARKPLRPRYFNTFNDSIMIYENFSENSEKILQELSTISNDPERGEAISKTVHNLAIEIKKQYASLDRNNKELELALERAELGSRKEDPYYSNYMQNLKTFTKGPIFWMVANPEKTTGVALISVISAIILTTGYLLFSWAGPQIDAYKETQRQSAVATQKANATQLAVSATQQAYAIEATAQANQLYEQRKAEIAPYSTRLEIAKQSALQARNNGQLFTEEELSSAMIAGDNAIEGYLASGIMDNLELMIQESEANLADLQLNPAYKVVSSWTTLYFQVYSTNGSSVQGLVSTPKFAAVIDTKGTYGEANWGDDKSIIVIPDGYTPLLTDLFLKDYKSECDASGVSLDSCFTSDSTPGSFESSLYMRQDGRFVVGLAPQAYSTNVEGFYDAGMGPLLTDKISADDLINRVTKGQYP